MAYTEREAQGRAHGGIAKRKQRNGLLVGTRISGRGKKGWLWHQGKHFSHDNKSIAFPPSACWSLWEGPRCLRPRDPEHTSALLNSQAHARSV